MNQQTAENGIYHVLVIFDITDDKRRRGATKILKGFGMRIQKSAFECRIDLYKYRKLCKKLQKVINLSQDALKIYRFTDIIETQTFGVMPVEPEYKEFDII